MTIKSLHDHTKEELIGLVQHYQEMVSELESLANFITFDNYKDIKPQDRLRLERYIKQTIRSIIYKDDDVRI